MKSFSREFIEQVRMASDIIAFISEDTTLKGQGDRYLGLCPFPDHNEKTPSFSVSASKQVYHCFGCQKAGNIFHYLEGVRGMNFPEAVHYLARQASIEIPKTFQKEKGPSVAPLFDLNEKACKFYQAQLLKCPADHPVKKYLKQRGYTEEIIKNFRLGYAPSGNLFLKTLNSVEQSQAITLGLLGKNNNNQAYDNFRNRLIFPIVSTRQQVIGFGARALDDSLPKYINSKQSPVFNKSNCFYGLNDSSRHLKQGNFLLVVEGYTDFLSLWQAGFRNIVATLGTALTTQHARLLKRYVDSVVLIFDGDAAGIKASERSLPLLLEESLEVKTIQLPDKKDPDDFVKEKGKQALENLIQNSQDLFFQILKNKLEKIQQEGRNLVYLLDEMSPFLQACKKDSLQVIYKQRLLDLFGTDKKAMENVLNNLLNNSSSKKPAAAMNKQESEDLSGKISIHEALKAEKILLCMCLESETFLQEFISQSGLDLLKTSNIKQIFEQVCTDYRQNSKNFANMLPSMMDQISDNNLLLKTNYPILKGANEEEQKKIFSDSISYLKTKKISLQTNEIISDIKMNGADDMKQLEKVMQLTKERLRQKSLSKK